MLPIQLGQRQGRELEEGNFPCPFQVEPEATLISSLLCPGRDSGAITLSC